MWYQLTSHVLLFFPFEIQETLLDVFMAIMRVRAYSHFVATRYRHNMTLAVVREIYLERV